MCPCGWTFFLGGLGYLDVSRLRPQSEHRPTSTEMRPLTEYGGARPGRVSGAALFPPPARGGIRGFVSCLWRGPAQPTPPPPLRLPAPPPSRRPAPSGGRDKPSAP